MKRILCFLLAAYVIALCGGLHASAVPKISTDPRVIYGIKNASKKVALTFDDGPHPILTPKILAILNEYDVKATFFVIGQNVTYYPKPLEQILAQGCEIGSHTYHHGNLGKMDTRQIYDELIQTEQALCEWYDYTVTSFRPPEGHLSEAVLSVADQMQYRTILWSIDTEDWAHTPPEQIAQRVLNQIGDGDIILMHDFIGHDSPTCEALRIFIPQLLEQGYEFVTVRELIGTK